MKIAVISASIDAYDPIRPAPFIEGEADWFMFTDVPPLETAAPWRKIVLPRPEGMGARAFSRRIKCLPWEYLPGDYDVSIWIDASAIIKSDRFVAWAAYRCLAGNVASWSDWPTQIPFAVWSHPNRQCVYAEERAIYDLQLLKYADQPLDHQVAHYRSEGYPEDNGLYACGTIARLHTSANLIVGRAWQREQERWGTMDQLALPVVFWRLGLAPVTFEENQIVNDVLQFQNHERKD